MELSLEVIAKITAIATIAVWLLTFVWMGILKQPKPSENVLKALVFAASVGLSYYFNPVALPEFSGDPIVYAVSLLTVAVAVFKYAQLLYDLLWQKIVEGLAVRVSVLGFLSTAR